MLTKDPSARAGVGDCLKHPFCKDARVERVDDLGNKFKDSEKHIILSKNDVDMALSITKPKGKYGPTTTVVNKRYSAPDISTDRSPAGLFRYTVAAQSAISPVKPHESNVTTMTEESPQLHDNSNQSAGSSSPKEQKKTLKVGLSAKFKMKKWWQRK